jgi:hypothetical protein
MHSSKTKVLITALSLFLISIKSYCQKPETTFMCSYTAGAINEKSICNLLGFQTRQIAQKAVERIVSMSGLRQNFYVMECPNIDNCFAATRNGERLIVYDASFMRRVNSMTKTDWGAMSILSHEIGHHLQGHTIKPGGSDPNRELEADEFSGFVMYQMGSSLKDAQSAIWKLTTDYDTGSHPPRRKRMASIKKGYQNAMAMYPNMHSGVMEIEPTATKPNVVVINNKPKEIKTGCIEGNCHQGFGVAINRRSLEKYAGNWKKGRREGYGIEYYASGEKKFEGDFDGSKFHGYGSYYFKNGDKYVGKFKGGLMHDDRPTFQFANGNRLFVRFIKGKKEGKGRMLSNRGKRTVVFYENDRKQ